ncbi:hypothetical protein [Massilia sp. WF1]|uniref:hypothetical protein n=1 Tax=Massilia sp. WF1 TaxID=1406431 RepID=UPI0012E2C630|nr:hypothetical protein [Massilia sp. WF1]
MPVASLDPAIVLARKGCWARLDITHPRQPKSWDGGGSSDACLSRAELEAAAPRI